MSDRSKLKIGITANRLETNLTWLAFVRGIQKQDASVLRDRFRQLRRATALHRFQPSRHLEQIGELFGKTQTPWRTQGLGQFQIMYEDVFVQGRLQVEQVKKLDASPQEFDGLVGGAPVGEQGGHVHPQHFKPQLVPLKRDRVDQFLWAVGILKVQQARDADVGTIVGLIGARNAMTAFRVMVPDRRFKRMNLP